MRTPKQVKASTSQQSISIKQPLVPDPDARLTLKCSFNVPASCYLESKTGPSPGPLPFPEQASPFDDFSPRHQNWPGVLSSTWLGPAVIAGTHPSKGALCCLHGPYKLIIDTSCTTLATLLSALHLMLQRPGKAGKASGIQTAPTVWEKSDRPTTAIHIKTRLKHPRGGDQERQREKEERKKRPVPRVIQWVIRAPGCPLIPARTPSSIHAADEAPSSVSLSVASRVPSTVSPTHSVARDDCRNTSCCHLTASLR